MKGSRTAARVAAKLRSLTVDVPNDCFQFTEECAFAKMLVPELSVLSIVVVVPK